MEGPTSVKRADGRPFLDAVSHFQSTAYLLHLTELRQTVRELGVRESVPASGKVNASTCQFVAIDFDKAGWQEDALAVLATGTLVGAPASVERSRSGNGGHVWIFFEGAISATLARRLGAHILTETMEQRPEIGLDSYDRLIPNQDTLRQGGFRNLIVFAMTWGVIRGGWLLDGAKDLAHPCGGHSV